MNFKSGQMSKWEDIVPYPWIFLITFLILIGGILYKKIATDRLNRENSIKNNKQTVIRAIGEQFEMQRHGCLQVKNKSTNVSSNEIQQIVKNLEQDLAQLYQHYESCIHAIQASMDEALFEQAKSYFSSQAIANQERLDVYTREINQMDTISSQQNLIRVMIQLSEPLMKKIENLLDNCSLSIWTAKLNALKSEMENFLSQTVSRVDKTNEEIEQLKIRYHVEASLKDFGMKIQECERTIEQKDNTLKNIKKSVKDMREKYLSILNTLPKNVDEDFLDDGNLKAKVDSLKTETDKGFQCRYCFTFLSETPIFNEI